jgi:hypothetical protein
MANSPADLQSIVVVNAGLLLSTPEGETRLGPVPQLGFSPCPRGQLSPQPNWLVKGAQPAALVGAPQLAR